MKFEYIILEARLFEQRLESLEKQLNELGSEGWEMVAACGAHGQTFILKRQQVATRRPGIRQDTTKTA